MLYNLDSGSKETLQYELFIKPTIGIFLTYNSGHPRSSNGTTGGTTIMNSARNELYRDLRSGSTQVYKRKGGSKIKEMLRSNEFPEKVVQNLHNQVKVGKPKMNEKEKETWKSSAEFLHYRRPRYSD